ncbi:MAG: hypothetical protein DRO88_02540 [Promethearchaeia archaeon]|nr:MAG: hypothetical protein DRO88_02540 [Candidatus Lokiarchaeia archaeon]
MSVELVSFSELKNVLGLEGDTIDEYPALAIIREGVTSAIEEFIGRELTQKEREETIYVGKTFTSMIYLKALPVHSVSSIIIDSWGEEITLSDSDFQIVKYGVELLSSINRSKVKVTYTGGLIDEDVSARLNRAALLQTIYEFQTKEHIGATSVYTDGGSVSTPELGLLKEIQRMLTSEIHPLKW